MYKETVLRQLLADYARSIEGLDLLFLFGSHASGRARAESDVDIALSFTHEMIPEAEKRIELIGSLSDQLGREVDLVVLNQASPILKMQVLRNGEKLFERDRRAYSDFFVKTVNEYDYLKRVRHVNEQKMLERAHHG